MHTTKPTIPFGIAARIWWAYTWRSILILIPLGIFFSYIFFLVDTPLLIFSLGYKLTFIILSFLTTAFFFGETIKMQFKQYTLKLQRQDQDQTVTWGIRLNLWWYVAWRIFLINLFLTFALYFAVTQDLDTALSFSIPYYQTDSYFEYVLNDNGVAITGIGNYVLAVGNFISSIIYILASIYFTGKAVIHKYSDFQLALVKSKSSPDEHNQKA